MLILSIAILSLAALINYRIGGRAALFPPFAFCVIWTFGLVLLLCAGDYFYPVKPKTIFVFICGAFAFCVGSWIAWFLPEKSSTCRPLLPAASNRILNWLLAAVVITAPFLYRWFSGLMSLQQAAGSFLSIAKASTEDVLRGSWTFTIFGTLTELSRIVAALAFYDREGHKKRAWFAVILSLAMSILWGGKYGPMVLVLSLFTIEWMQKKRLSWKLVLGTAAPITIIATVFLYYILTDQRGSFMESVSNVGHLFILYCVGGLVAYDQFLRSPGIVPQEMNPFHTYYLRIVGKLGGHVNIPSFADFVTVGPANLQENIYTMYWCYMDLGWFGVFAMTAVAGFLITMVYKRAITGRRVAVMIYCILLIGIVFSTFNEGFFSQLLLLSKVWFVSWLVYHSPLRWRQFTTMISSRAVALSQRSPVLLPGSLPDPPNRIRWSLKTFYRTMREAVHESVRRDLKLRS